MPILGSIHPNTPLHAIDFSILNDYLESMKIIGLTDKAQEDNKKVVECIKYIKVNIQLIADFLDGKVADNRNTFDITHNVLRDFNGTSFHLNSYKTGASAQRGLTDLIQQFENAVVSMKQIGKLLDFAEAIYWDDDIGCLEARTARSLEVAALNQSTDYPQLNKLFETINDKFDQRNNTKSYRIALAYLHSYLNKIVIFENKEIKLTSEIIRQYLEDTPGFDISDLERVR